MDRVAAEQLQMMACTVQAACVRPSSWREITSMTWSSSAIVFATARVLGALIDGIVQPVQSEHPVRSKP
jgi:hypothetical protein